jgi:hypothetical protein
MKQMDMRLGQRWDEFQPSKSALFWTFIVGVVLTIVIGFYWGGWVTGGTAQQMATTTSQQAVVQRLSSICVAQFNQDPERDVKLAELKGLTTTQRTTFVRNQGWATMPGETQADRRVVDECARRLMALE